jgi:hypothetical protein
MAVKDESYSIFGENGDKELIRIDVVTDTTARTRGKSLGRPGGFGLMFFEPEDEQGNHALLSFKQFKDIENLQLAQMGLELLRIAAFKEMELEDSK